MNDAEQFVAQLCRNTFLSLWSYPNPLGKGNKELCDLLVVCDPHVLIFSVKQISVPESGDSAVDRDRWQRRAVDDSVKQIYGAERSLATADRVAPNDDMEGLPLPSRGIRRTHRLAVAIGRGDKFPLSSGDFGKGYVHVLDEVSLPIVLTELDTITDFVDYLAAKQKLRKRGTSIIQAGGGEEDLLAWYLAHNRSFPERPGLSMFEPGMWAEFCREPEYLAKKNEDEVSYQWDQIIEKLNKDFRLGRLEEGGVSNNTNWLSVRWRGKPDLPVESLASAS